MRLEQLVLVGPTDDERIRFDAGITVFGGLTPAERASLITTVVEALTGRLANSSLVFTDNAGERIFADRTGATYATTGARAPGPGDLLGRDPAIIRNLLVLDAGDLRADARATADQLRSRLAAAQAEVAAAVADLTEQRRLVQVVVQEHEGLAELDRAIDRSRDDAARWVWVQRRRQLDELRAELAMYDRPEGSAGDRRLLEAVESLRSTGETWAAAAAEASELRAELGELPAVSARDLALVADTPDGLPEQLGRDLDRWAEARLDRERSAADLEAARATPLPPEDPMVAAFSALDQALLWPIHRELIRSNEAYEASVEKLDQAEVDEELAARIEAAHVEVLRRQRRKDLLFRPGMLGSGLLAVGALLAGRTIAIELGALSLLAAVGMAYWLITLPRRRLARAEHDEAEILAEAGVDSWLGVHMRRLDSVDDHAERKRLTQAANDRAAAMADWRDLAGDLDPDDLSACAEQVWEYTDAINPVAARARIAHAEEALDAATTAEAHARKTAAAGLSPYGLTPDELAGREPDQRRRLLETRVEAGRVARAAQRLAALDQIEERVGGELDGLLARLGFEGGERSERLERAIRAVSAARARTGSTAPRSRAALESEIAHLDAEVQAARRPSWDLTADPVDPPISPEELAMRRLELAEQIAARTRPDVVGAERRVEMARSAVAEVERELEHLTDPGASRQQRLAARLLRTTSLGGVEATLPVILDDAFSGVPGPERLELLDVLHQLSLRTQVIVLTDDPAVSIWARGRATSGAVTLYESEPGVVPVSPVAAAPAGTGGLGARTTASPG